MSMDQLVVIVGGFSLPHGGERFDRIQRHAQKLRQLWGHVPPALGKFICAMSDPERPAGKEAVVGEHTFSQSSPQGLLGKETLVVPGRPPLDEATATEIIVRFI